MHASPPVTTLIVGENQAATSPASNRRARAPGHDQEKMVESRPRSRSGTMSCSDRRPEDRADHVGGAGDREEEQGERQVRPHQTERGDRRPPPGHRPDHRLTLPPDAADAARQQDLREGADGRCREEQSDHGLATVELAHGQHREERGRHAEDHRDQVDHERRLRSADGARRSGIPRPPPVHRRWEHRHLRAAAVASSPRRRSASRHSSPDRPRMPSRGCPWRRSAPRPARVRGCRSPGTASGRGPPPAASVRRRPSGAPMPVAPAC